MSLAPNLQGAKTSTVQLNALAYFAGKITDVKEVITQCDDGVSRQPHRTQPTLESDARESDRPSHHGTPSPPKYQSKPILGQGGFSSFPVRVDVPIPEQGSQLPPVAHHSKDTPAGAPVIQVDDITLQKSVASGHEFKVPAPVETGSAPKGQGPTPGKTSDKSNDSVTILEVVTSGDAREPNDDKGHKSKKHKHKGKDREKSKSKPEDKTELNDKSAKRAKISPSESDKQNEEAGQVVAPSTSFGDAFGDLDSLLQEARESRQLSPVKDDTVDAEGQSLPMKKAKTQWGSTPKGTPKKSTGRWGRKTVKSAETVEDTDDSDVIPGPYVPGDALTVEQWCDAARNDAWANDRSSFQDYQLRKGINISSIPKCNHDDHSAYVKFMIEKEGPFSIHEAGEWEKKIKSNCHEGLPGAQRKLDAIRQAQKATLARGVRPRYFVEVFTYPGAPDQMIPYSSSNLWGRDYMIGLYQLFLAKSIARKSPTQKSRLKANIGFCGLCDYYVGNSMTLNNHVRMHLRLGLVCVLGDCFFFTTKAEDMLSHAHRKHPDVFESTKGSKRN